MMHDMWGHMEGGGYWLMGLLCVLAIVGLIALIVWAIGAAGGQKTKGGAAPTSAESPLELLKRRYANGELSDEEYEEKKRRLMQ